jgi:hypothetical protein
MAFSHSPLAIPGPMRGAGLIGHACAKLIGDPSFVSLVNNKHPLVPLSTLHGLAAECLHATLVQFKRQRQDTLVPAPG